MADNGYSAANTPPATDAQGNKAQLDLIATARKRMNVVIDATNNNRVYQTQDLRFLAGSPDNKYQWPEGVVRLRESDPNGPRPVLTINKLPQHVFQVTNEQRQNRPSIKILPVDDKGDEEVAEVLTGIIRHIEYLSDAEVAYSIASDSQVAVGEGYLRVLTDFVDEKSFEQDLIIAGVKNGFSVYMDPVGLQRDATGRYCEWAFVVEDLNDDDYARQFPKAQPVNWDLVGNGDEWKAWFPDSHTVRIAEYFYFEYEDKSLCLWPDGSVTVKGDPQEAIYANAGITPVKERQTRIRHLKWCKMSGLEVLEERDLPGKYIPVVRMVGNEWYIDGRMVCAGLVRNAKDAQRMFNYWKSTECEVLALAPKAPYLAPAEAIEGYEDQWQYANTKNFPYLRYNQFAENGERIDRPSREVPPMPPVGIVNAALGAADDIKSATGQYDPSLGNNPQAKSGVALAREQRKTDIGTFHYIDNQGRAVRQLGRILVDAIPHYYDTRRIARIIGEDGETDHVTIDPDQPQAITKTRDAQGIEQVVVNPSIGTYDVIVSVGPSFTSKRQEAAQMMSDVLQGQPQLMGVIGDLYFKMLDVPGAEEIAARLKKTLPPGLAEDENEPEPMVQTPQGPVPASKASEMIAQLMGGLEQSQIALEKSNAEANEAKARAAQNEAHKIRLQALNDEREVILKEAASRQKDEELDIRRFEAETARMAAESKAATEVGAQEAQRIEAEATVAAARESFVRAQTEQMQATGDAFGPISEALKALADAQNQATETEVLERDNDGIPTRTRSRKVRLEAGA